MAVKHQHDKPNSKQFRKNKKYSYLCTLKPKQNMPKKPQAPKILSNIAITDIAAEGQAIARHNGKVIFVENAVPGDVADLLVLRQKNDFSQTRIQQLISPSPDRTTPFCQHFGICGGCRWQQLEYDRQAQYKQQIAEDAFRRIGKLQHPPFLPIIKAVPETYYRNKLEFTFSTKRWLTNDEIAREDETPNRNALGFHVGGMFDRVVDVQHCHLQPEPSNSIRNFVRQIAQQQDLSFYDLKNHEGLLRNLIIRTTTTNEVMVNVCFGHDDAEKRALLLDALVQQFPQITSLHYTINTKRNDSIFDQQVITYQGRGYIIETLENLQFKISPKSFFQTNPYQTLQLYKIVRNFAQLTPDETVYDLYTGTGSIALFVAQQCKQVIGIEEVPDAIADAKQNASHNQIHNAHFYAGDVKKLLNNELTQIHGQPDVLITDPPRAGMHADVVQQIIDFAPKRIVYVSCNPATQARDLQLLANNYAVNAVQPVDMFPHTFHVENVAVLEQRR